MLEQIATGGEFDVILAVRGLATEVIKLRAALAEMQPVEQGQISGEVVLGPPGLAEVLGNSRLASFLARGGFGSVESLRAATDEQLLSVVGVNAKGIEQIRGKLG